MRNLLSKARAWLAKVPAKARVLMRAWPTYAATATAALTLLSTAAEGVLPHNWAVTVLGILGYLTVFVAAVSAAVARVTPILLPEQKGLLPPEPEQPEPGVTVFRDV